MHLLVIEPLVGVNELKLGQVINHDTEFLGLSEDYIHRGDNWQTKYYWNGQLTVKYDDKNRVTHIGIRNLGKLSFEVVLFGRKVFETPVADMIDLITQTAKTSFIKSDSELPYTYKFPDLSMTLWREYIPEDINNRDMKEVYEAFEYIGIGQKK